MVDAVHAYAYTKQGNPYVKTKKARKVLPLLAMGVGVASTVASAVVLHKMPPSAQAGKGFKQFMQTLGVVGLKNLGGTIAGMFSGFLVGLGIDGIVNHHRRKKADKMANVSLK